MFTASYLIIKQLQCLSLQKLLSRLWKWKQTKRDIAITPTRLGMESDKKTKRQRHSHITVKRSRWNHESHNRLSCFDIAVLLAWGYAQWFTESAKWIRAKSEKLKCGPCVHERTKAQLYVGQSEHSLFFINFHVIPLFYFIGKLLSKQTRPR